LIYATAFEKGISEDFVINDAPFTVRNPDGSSWSPQNWSKKYHGPTTLRDGLIHSRNIVTIKLLKKIGVKTVIQLAQKAGVQSPLQPELTLALGASPVSLLEMTGAYTLFTNQGRYRQPRAITEVKDRQGNNLRWPPPRAKQVLQPRTAAQVTSLLEQVISKGTGQRAKGISGSAGKTGTTDNNRDGWFIGYTSNLLTGIWVGHDKNQPLGKQGTGGRTAAPIWLDFMRSTSLP
jgi:penicillin-binding protein 1A